MQRREFLLRTMQAGAAVVIPITVISCSKDDDNDIDPDGNGNGNNIVIDLDTQDYTLLNTAGNAVVINNIIIANTGSDQFVALSAVCTHNGCQITYNHSSGNFPCPCHGSIFAADGSVVEGPASTAVKRYTVSREDNVLTVQL